MIKEPLLVPMLWGRYDWSGQHGEVEWHGVFSRGSHMMLHNIS